MSKIESLEIISDKSSYFKEFSITLRMNKIFSILCDEKIVDKFLFDIFLGNIFFKLNDKKYTFQDLIRNNILSIFQQYPKFEKYFKVYDIFRIYSYLYNKNKNFINSLLKEINFLKIKNQNIFKLNSSEILIVYLLTSFLNPSYFYIIKEPTKNIDYKEKIWNFIKKIKNKNKGFLIISSNAKEVEEVSDFVYIFKDNVLVEKGNPKELVNKYLPKFLVTITHDSKNLESFLEALERKRGIKIIHADNKIIKLEAEKVEDSLRRIFFSAEQTNTNILNIYLTFPTLFEVYKLIKGEKFWEA